MGRPLAPHVARQLEGYLVDCWRTADRPRLQYRALLLSLGLHALRAQEVCNLEVRDFDPATPMLRVRSVKGGTHRHVPLDPTFAACIAGTLSRRHGPKLPKHFLFVTQRGQKFWPANLHSMVRIVSAQLKIPFTFHCLRHTAALRLWTNTHDVLALMRLLGHSTLAVTHRYLQTFTTIPLDAFPQWRTLRPDLTELRIVSPPGWNFKREAGPHPRWGA